MDFCTSAPFGSAHRLLCSYASWGEEGSEGFFCVNKVVSSVPKIPQGGWDLSYYFRLEVASGPEAAQEHRQSDLLIIIICGHSLHVEPIQICLQAFLLPLFHREQIGNRPASLSAIELGIAGLIPQNYGWFSVEGL